MGQTEYEKKIGRERRLDSIFTLTFTFTFTFTLTYPFTRCAAQ